MREKLKILKDDLEFDENSSEESDIKKDAFNHRAIAETIFDVFKDNDAPLTIGLFGGWGMGKSSIVNLIKKKVSGKNTIYKYSYFNAWQYSEDSFRREFLLSIARSFNISKRKIRRLEKLNQSDTVNYKFSFSNFRWDWYSFFKFIQTLFICYVAYYFLSEKGLIEKLGPLTASIYTIVIGAITLFTPRIEQILKIDNTIDHKLIYSEQFYDEFEKIIKEKCDKTKKTPKYTPVIVIDDLDRCNPDTISTILNTLKSFLSHKDCVFIVPIDDNAVVQALSSSNKNFGYEQLRKYFSISIRIPVIHDEDIKDFARKSARENNIPEEVAIIGALGNCNDPRKMKHFINQFILKYSVAKKRSKEEFLPNIDVINIEFQKQLAKICVLEYQYPEAFEFFSTYPFLYEWFTLATSKGSDNMFDGLLRELHPTYNNNLNDIWLRFPGLKSFLKSTHYIDLPDFNLLAKLKVTHGERQIPNFSRQLYSYIYNAEQFQQYEFELDLDQNQITEYSSQIVDTIEKQLQGTYSVARLNVFSFGVRIYTLNQLIKIQNDRLFTLLITIYCGEEFAFDFKEIPVKQILALLDGIQHIKIHRAIFVQRLLNCYIQPNRISDIKLILQHQYYRLLLETDSDFSMKINVHLSTAWQDFSKNNTEEKAKLLNEIYSISLTKDQKNEYRIDFPNNNTFSSLLTCLAPKDIEENSPEVDNLSKIATTILLNKDSFIDFVEEKAEIGKALTIMFIHSRLGLHEFPPIILENALEISTTEHIYLNRESALEIARLISANSENISKRSSEYHNKFLCTLIKCYSSVVEESDLQFILKSYEDLIPSFGFEITKRQFDIINTQYYSNINGIDYFRKLLVNTWFTHIEKFYFVITQEILNENIDIASFCLLHKEKYLTNNEFGNFICNLLSSELSIIKCWRNIIKLELEQCTHKQREYYIDILVKRIKDISLDSEPDETLRDLFGIALINHPVERARDYNNMI
ncbi:MAG: hypothetical protein JST20_05695 [Bacteroidetes bacterium]|nr:hypothetical protein [Bacteroidota bacterium]